MFGNAPGILRRSVVRHDALFQFRRVGNASDQTIDARHVECLMDEHVGALGELDEAAGARRIAGIDEGAVGGFKAIGARGDDRRMVPPGWT